MDRTSERDPSVHDPGLLAAYVEDRLDADERRLLTLHLASCSECRQVLAMLARAPGLRPKVGSRRLAAAAPIWLGLAATVVLVTLAVRRTDAPVATVAPPPPASVVVEAAGTPAVPAGVDASPAAAAPAGDPMLDPALLVKRGAPKPRHVGDKTFRLVAGEWIDAGFDSGASLPMTVVQGRAARAAAVKRLPALEPYAALGERVVVVVDGLVYRFVP